MFATDIKGQTPFPQFSFVVKLGDIRVLYYNGDTETFIGIGNTTNEDSVYDPNNLKSIGDNVQRNWAILENLNTPKGKQCAKVFLQIPK